jgi:hypothetical protein
MAIRRKKDESLYPDTSESNLWVCIEGFSTDLSDGRPVTVSKGETFEEGHELLERFKSTWFVPEGTSSWKRQEILQRRLDARAG